MAVAACGARATPTLIPDALYDQTVATTLAAGSFRFNAVWYVRPSDEADEASGEWVAPNRYHATQLGAEVISIGDMTYIRPLTDDA